MMRWSGELGWGFLENEGILEDFLVFLIIAAWAGLDWVG